MLIYMAIPVLIIVGLCIFFYMAGRYVHIRKKQEKVKAPEIIKEPEYPKVPDRTPILEGEIRNLKEALEAKNKELEERNVAIESIMQENQKLLAQTRQENIYNIDEKAEEAGDAANLKESLPQPEPEKEPAVDNIAALPAPSSCEDTLEQPEEKAERKRPKEKVKRKKYEEKAKRKPRRKKR